MKYKQTTITFRAFNMTHEIKATSKKYFTLEQAEFYIWKKFAESAVVIKVKVAEKEIFNPDYKEFKIETTVSDGVIKNK